MSAVCPSAPSAFGLLALLGFSHADSPAFGGGAAKLPSARTPSCGAQEQIKGLITSLMLSAPPPVRAQLSEALTIISGHDFPGRWKGLLPELCERLGASDPAGVNGVLETANSIFKRCAPRLLAAGTRQSPFPTDHMEAEPRTACCCQTQLAGRGTVTQQALCRHSAQSRPSSLRLFVTALACPVAGTAISS